MEFTWWQWALLGLPALVNLAGIWHVLKCSILPPLRKLVWVALFVLFPVVPGLVYFLLLALRKR